MGALAVEFPLSLIRRFAPPSPKRGPWSRTREKDMPARTQTPMEILRLEVLRSDSCQTMAPAA